MCTYLTAVVRVMTVLNEEKYGTLSSQTIINIINKFTFKIVNQCQNFADSHGTTLSGATLLTRTTRCVIKNPKTKFIT